MSSNRRLEYDKGPRLDSETEDRGDDGSAPDERDESSDDGRYLTAVPPWAAGLVSGTSAFAIVFAVTYQIVSAMDATGALSGPEEGPSRMVLTGFVNLAGHGAVIEANGEPVRMAFSGRISGGLTSHLTPLIPIVALLAAAYLLVRHVPLETRRDVGLALGATVTSYVVLTVGLATTAEWTPEDRPEAETIAVAVDAATVMAVARTAIVFVAIGAALAALPRILKLESTDSDEGSADEPAADAA
ncbi:hypothetical protein [Halosolutus gelatinilyticus]|uniref:hypothetical protein n=1 Tax=Halosolutus gelatinilyticus TaxID=2931975 RepID=UPI001FF697BD|nr:hypothetical protein [Halosolutus gelatinilyticus]